MVVCDCAICSKNRKLSHITRVVYHLPKKIWKFWMECKCMERLILSPLTEIYSGIRDFSKGRSKFQNGISEWKMCVPFVSFYWVRIICLGSSLILSSGKKSWKWNERVPLKISVWDLTRTIYYNYRPTFFRVNGKQSGTLLILEMARAYLLRLLLRFLIQYNTKNTVVLLTTPNRAILG